MATVASKQPGGDHFVDQSNPYTYKRVRRITACEGCRKRKIRCDAVLPCNACWRRQDPCRPTTKLSKHDSRMGGPAFAKLCLPKLNNPTRHESNPSYSYQWASEVEGHLIGCTPQHDTRHDQERQSQWCGDRRTDHEPSYELTENLMAPITVATPLGSSININEDPWHEVSGMHGFGSLNRQMTSCGQDFRASCTLQEGNNILAPPGFEYCDERSCLPVSIDGDISMSFSDTRDSQRPLEWLPDFQWQHHYADPDFLGTHPHTLHWTSFGHGTNLRLHPFQEETSLAVRQQIAGSKYELTDSSLDQRRESLAPASLIDSVISRQRASQSTIDEESESAGTANFDETVGPSNEHETHGLLETGVAPSPTEIHIHGGSSSEEEQPKKRKHQWEEFLQPGSNSSVPKYRRQEHEIHQARTVLDVFQNHPRPADYNKETVREDGSDQNSKLDGDEDLAALRTSSSEERSLEGTERFKSNPIDCQPENFRIHATHSPGMKPTCPTDAPMESEIERSPAPLPKSRYSEKTKRGKERGIVPQACVECRSHKIKCSGKKPACDRCSKFSKSCEYKVPSGKFTAWIGTKTKAGKERRRAPQACVRCRSRKIKCSGETPTCDRCSESSKPCEYR